MIFTFFWLLLNYQYLCNFYLTLFSVLFSIIWLILNLHIESITKMFFNDQEIASSSKPKLLPICNTHWLQKFMHTDSNENNNNIQN